MAFLNALDTQPYMNALNALATQTGPWIAIGGGLDRIAFDFDFLLGAGNITGSVSVQYTSQLNGMMPSTGTRIILPAGCLHFLSGTVALASSGTAIVLTAMSTTRFAIMLGSIPPGNIRAVYTFTSGTGAAPNTVTCWATGC